MKVDMRPEAERAADALGRMMDEAIGQIREFMLSVGRSALEALAEIMRTVAKAMQPLIDMIRKWARGETPRSLRRMLRRFRRLEREIKKRRRRRRTLPPLAAYRHKFWPAFIEERRGVTVARLVDDETGAVVVVAYGHGRLGARKSGGPRRLNKRTRAIQRRDRRTT